MAPITPSRLQSSAARVATWLAAAALFAALALIASFAGIGAYIAMLLALPVLLIAFFNWRWFTDQDASFPLLFALAYAIFAVLIVFPDRPAGSAIYIFDFFPFALAIAVYVGLCRIGREALLSLLGHACLVGVVISAGVGAYEIFALSEARANGLGSAINYANISLILGFLALAPLFSRGSWRWYFAAAPVLAIAAALLSGSRSVVPVGLALSFVLLVHLLAWLRASRPAGVWLVAALSIGGLGAVAMVLMFLNLRQIDRITAVFGQLDALMRGEAVTDPNIAIRFDYYQAGIKAFLQASFTGHGWHDAISAAVPYMTVAHPAQRTTVELVHLHNDLLQFAVAFGIWGILAYLLVLSAPIVAWARATPLRLGYGSYAVFAVVLSFFAMGLTNTNFFFEAPKAMFCLAAAAAAALACKRAGDSPA